MKQKVNYHRTCPVCGSNFSTSDSRKIYCSVQCCNKAAKAKKRARYRANHQKVPLTSRPCIVCGKLFTPEKSNAKLICSEECKRKRVRAKHSVYYSHRKPKPQPKKQRELAQNAHNLRMQRQLEAKENGLTYGQYVALLGGE